MIISASYKTDIPTFYGKWLLNRLDAGYCKTINPYNKKSYRIGLKRSEVDGFVFWTKNIRPFIDNLEEIHERGYPFIIQYTINAYPRELEHSVVDARKSIEDMKDIRDSYGPRAAVWRYDTILFTSLTPFKFHMYNFSTLAEALEGTTDEVIISFAQFYRKTRKNLNSAAQKSGFSWEDPPESEKLNLISELAKIAKSHMMQLRICSQPSLVTKEAKAASCVDTERLSEIAGYVIDTGLKPRRPGCGCHASRDIGEYDTCPHGCVYCYAVKNRRLAVERFKRHDPQSEFLFEPTSYTEAGEKEKFQKDQHYCQMKLPIETE